MNITIQFHQNSLVDNQINSIFLPLPSVIRGGFLCPCGKQKRCCQNTLWKIVAYTLWIRGFFIFKEIKHLSLSIPVLFLDVLAAGLTDYPSTIHKNHYCCSNIVRILVKPVHSEHI